MGWSLGSARERLPLHSFSHALLHVSTGARASSLLLWLAVKRGAVKLQIAQDLMRLRTLGSWRFLMALRKGTLDTADDEDLLMAGNPARRGPAVHQVSAGLSVLF